MEERRQGDLLIMDKLSAMHTDLALNTQATKQTTEQVTKLNGKVAHHETRLQSIEATQSLTASTLAQLQASNTEKKKEIKDWMDWLVKGVIAVGLALFYYLLTHNGFPNFLN